MHVERGWEVGRDGHGVVSSSDVLITGLKNGPWQRYDAKKLRYRPGNIKEGFFFHLQYFQNLLSRLTGQLPSIPVTLLLVSN